MKAENQETELFAIPASRTELLRLQSERKRAAIALARQSPFMRERVAHIDLECIDDEAAWRKIPILSKDELRNISNADFYGGFCLSPAAAASELWRSGGSTGRPLFYPRSQIDMQVALSSFERVLVAIGIKAPGLVHNSLPLGIHPAGQLFSRAAERRGFSVLWAGAGNTTGSRAQLDLLAEFKPVLWIGMPSYALHLGNLARGEGIDPRSFGVKKILCTAEALSDPKRERIAEIWQADVHDCLGMTEISMLAAEVSPGRGLRLWTDLVYAEVVDAQSLQAVAAGEVGSLIVTSLASNTITPFVRWQSGDLVSIAEGEADNTVFDVFPLMRHAHRTAGFSKVRGVNIGHLDFEDLMFRCPEVRDFRAEVINSGDHDKLRVFVEIHNDIDETQAIRALTSAIRAMFEVNAELVLQSRGETARFFEGQIKAQRFTDNRDPGA